MSRAEPYRRAGRGSQAQEDVVQPAQLRTLRGSQGFEVAGKGR